MIFPFFILYADCGAPMRYILCNLCISYKRYNICEEHRCVCKIDPASKVLSPDSLLKIVYNLRSETSFSSRERKNCRVLFSARGCLSFRAPLITIQIYPWERLSPISMYVCARQLSRGRKWIVG